MVPDGYTNERWTIEQRIQRNGTSPQTHQPLQVKRAEQNPHKSLPLGPGAMSVQAEFKSQIEASIRVAAESAQRETDRARAQLAEVNLPQSLDAYTAFREAGGGIPPRMWEAIKSVQHNHDIDQLRHNLWALKDVADHAQSTFAGLVRRFDDDVESDRLFRDEHPDFPGRDARRAQDPLRSQVRIWEGRLEQARNGDEKLLCVLEELETEPKYQLLQCTRGQLEQLIPGREGKKNECDGEKGGDGSFRDKGDEDKVAGMGRDIDTAALRSALAGLSNLIRERQAAVEKFKAEAEAYDLRPALAEIGTKFAAEDVDGDNAKRPPPAKAGVIPSDKASAPSGVSGVMGLTAGLEGVPLAVGALPAASPAAQSTAPTEEDPVKLRRLQYAACSALRGFRAHLDLVHALNRRQHLYLERILEENARFCEALDRDVSASAGQDLIRNLKDALSTVDRAKRQLTEGRNFYDVVVPRLERLRVAVSDLSARLVAERLEYMDRLASANVWEERQRQEMEDAWIAASARGVSKAARERWSRFSYRGEGEAAAGAGGGGVRAPSSSPVAERRLGRGGGGHGGFWSVSNGPSCSICLSEYEEGECLVRLPCTHMYHEECVAVWVSNHVRCPLCNYDLEAGDHPPLT